MKRLVSALIFFFPANASFNNESTTPPITPSTPLAQIATGTNNQQTPPTVDHRRPTNPIPNDINFAAITRHIPFAQQPQQAVPGTDLELTANLLNVPQELRPSLEMLAIRSAIHICRQLNPTTQPQVVSQAHAGNRVAITTILPQTVSPFIFSQLINNEMYNIYNAFLNLQRPNLTQRNFSHQHAQFSLLEQILLFLQLQHRQNNPQ